MVGVAGSTHLEGQTHSMTRSRQQSTPPAMSVGPMRRSSSVLKPFSPVPTNAMTMPTATVPRPT